MGEALMWLVVQVTCLSLLARGRGSEIVVPQDFAAGAHLRRGRVLRLGERNVVVLRRRNEGSHVVVTIAPI